MPVDLADGAIDRRAEVLPPALLPLFDDAFVRSWRLYCTFVQGLVACTARDLGLVSLAGGRSVTAAELVSRCGYTGDGAQTVLDFMLRTLAQAGRVRVDEAGGVARFTLADLDELADIGQLRDAVLADDPLVAPSVELADEAAAALPAILEGEVTGERILLAPDRLALWGRYFSNDNPLYAINNRVGAEACVASLPPGKLRVLELGGGFGSAADALLGRLNAADRLADVASYHFSELVLPFLRRGQRGLQARWGDRVSLSFARIDMDQPLAEQGIGAGSIDVVWAVNTLHVAHDLRATLQEVCTGLAPGGVVVAGECVRPFADQALEPELIFNLLESYRSPLLDERWRPRGGFLTPEQWAVACVASGFAEVQLVPDVARVREHFADFVVAAVVARKG